MTARRPSKPWRVTLPGADVTAKTLHTSQAKAYTHVRAALTGDSAAPHAVVEHWQDGHWYLHAFVPREGTP